jgi:hypothetical protein
MTSSYQKRKYRCGLARTILESLAVGKPCPTGSFRYIILYSLDFAKLETSIDDCRYLNKEINSEIALPGQEDFTRPFPMMGFKCPPPADRAIRR